MPLLEDRIFCDERKSYLNVFNAPDEYIPIVPMRYPHVLCGVEIEVENIESPSKVLDSLKQREVWQVKKDGSLRNHGYEYVLNIPLHGAMLSYSLENFFQKLPENALFSPRTSLHFHLDVRHWTYEHLYRLAMVYMSFEKLLYVLAGGHRYHNIFCVPLTETVVPSMLSEENILGDMPLWEKYSGLNLGRIRDLGSVEFRQMEGNRDIKRILNWINVLMHLHQYAERTTMRDIREKLADLNSTSMYQVFLNEVFKEEAVLFIQYDLQKLMENGVTNAKMVRHKHEYSMKLKKELSLNSDLGQAFDLDAEMLRRP